MDLKHFKINESANDIYFIHFKLSIQSYEDQFVLQTIKCVLYHAIGTGNSTECGFVTLQLQFCGICIWAGIPTFRLLY